MMNIIKGVHLPPENLIFMDKDALSGLETGIKLVERMNEVGVKTHNGVLLDIGCGYGRIAYSLLNNNFSGIYIGVDILENRIRWLQENFTTIHPNFEFHYANVKNDRYNKKGIQSTATVDLKNILRGRPVSTILLLSVFTHMYEDDISNYLSSIRDIMKYDTQLVFTMFLYDQEIIEFLRKNLGRFSMSNILNDHCRYESTQDPLYAIAYHKHYLDKVLKKLKLKFSHYPGFWIGRKTEQFQDWVIARIE